MIVCRTCGEILYPEEKDKGVCVDCQKAINLLVAKGASKRVTNWNA